MKYIKMAYQELKNDYIIAKENFKNHPIKHIPNILTFLRILSGIFVLFIFALGNVSLAIIIAMIGSITDYFDGVLSRKLDAKSEFGRKLDTIADKELTTILMAINVIKNPLFMINMALEGFIAATNLMAHLKNKNAKTSQIGRVKTFVLYITLLLGVISNFIPELNLILYGSMLTTTLLQIGTYNQYKNTYQKYDNNLKRKDKQLIKEHTEEYSNQKVFDNSELNKKREYLKAIHYQLIEIKKLRENSIEEEDTIKTLKKR